LGTTIQSSDAGVVRDACSLRNSGLGVTPFSVIVGNESDIKTTFLRVEIAQSRHKARATDPAIKNMRANATANAASRAVCF
jgi:hypothetical protein